MISYIRGFLITTYFCIISYNTAFDKVFAKNAKYHSDGSIDALLLFKAVPKWALKTF